MNDPGRGAPPREWLGAAPPGRRARGVACFACARASVRFPRSHARAIVCHVCGRRRRLSLEAQNAWTFVPFGREERKTRVEEKRSERERANRPSTPQTAGEARKGAPSPLGPPPLPSSAMMQHLAWAFGAVREMEECWRARARPSLFSQNANGRIHSLPFPSSPASRKGSCAPSHARSRCPCQRPRPAPQGRPTRSRRRR